MAERERVPSGVISGVFQLAGALVGTAAVASTRVCVCVRSMVKGAKAPPSRAPKELASPRVEKRGGEKAGAKRTAQAARKTSRPRNPLASKGGARTKATIEKQEPRSVAAEKKLPDDKARKTTDSTDSAS